LLAMDDEVNDKRDASDLPRHQNVG
jgi:hypothetical protein